MESRLKFIRILKFIKHLDLKKLNINWRVRKIVNTQYFIIITSRGQKFNSRNLKVTN